MVAHTSAAPKPTSVVQARYNEAFFPRPLHDAAFDAGNAWPLSGSLDPIDDDRLAGKKRRFAGKEKDGVGDFLRRGGAFDRDALEEVRFTLAAPRESVEHLGLDRPRRHGIDAHAGLGTLKRRSLGQTFDSVLARGIDGSIRRADLAQCHLILRPLSLKLSRKRHRPAQPPKLRVVSIA